HTHTHTHTQTDTHTHTHTHTHTSSVHDKHTLHECYIHNWTLMPLQNKPFFTVSTNTEGFSLGEECERGPPHTTDRNVRESPHVPHRPKWTVRPIYRGICGSAVF